MDKPKSYCDAVKLMNADNAHCRYHDHAYGFPIEDDDELFGRLILEINQAGLNWTTILNKQENFRKAFDGFNSAKVAAYNGEDRARLLNDAGIIRNRLKVDAAIHNAKVIVDLQAEFGSFKAWLDLHHPKTRDQWTKLFKKTFKFTGGEIVNEFLMSAGYLPGAHRHSCPVYKKIAEVGPPWMQNAAFFG